LRSRSEQDSIVRPLQTPTKINSTGVTEAITENGGVNFIIPNSPDTAALQFAAPARTPTVQEPTGNALDEDDDDNTELVVRPPLSPRKPKSKPGPKRQATADLSRKFPSGYIHISPGRNDLCRLSRAYDTTPQFECSRERSTSSAKQVCECYNHDICADGCNYTRLAGLQLADNGKRTSNERRERERVVGQ
jgi:hypothetical protein